MNPTNLPPLQPNQPQESLLHKALFSGWLLRSYTLIFFIVLLIIPLAFIADNYFQRKFFNETIAPQKVFTNFNKQKASQSVNQTAPHSSDGCYVIVSGYLYNMQVRIGQTAVDPNTGKTHVHTIAHYQCGTPINPTDMTAIYLDKHGPMGCAQRIAPFIVSLPAPEDPTCM